MATRPPKAPPSVTTSDSPPLTPPIVAAAAPERLAIDSLFQFDAALRAGITENLTSRRAEAEAIADRVDRAFENFSPGSPAGGELERRHFVERGTDVSQTLTKAVHEGVESLRTSDAEHNITFRDRADLGSISVPSDQGEAPGRVVELGDLLSFLSRKSRGSSLVKAIGSPQGAEVEADKIVTDVENAVQVGNADVAIGDERSVDAREADQLVKDAVHLQMKSATSPETQLAYGSMPAISNTAAEDQTQKRILETFQLRPGASDVTSYHDFHTLQIAFPHVWTRIFDGELQSLGRELYSEYVKLKDFSGSASVDMPVTSLDDLRNLISEIRKLSQVVAREIPVDLRDTGGTGGETKSSKDLGDDVRTGVAVATGGASELLRWAIEEFSKIGQKPVITWEQFPGPWGNRTDTIDMSIADHVAVPGTVEIVLQTDPGSHVKLIEFEAYDPVRKDFRNGPSISNWSRQGPVPLVTLYLPTSLAMSAGVLEFGSEETFNNNAGRYLLVDLGRKLKDGSRVIFHWKDK